MACRHFHGTTGSPPPGTAHTPPRRPRWTVRPRSPSRTVADAHAAPPAAGQATASAAFLSPQQPNPVVVPSTPPLLGVLRRPVESAQYTSWAFTQLAKDAGLLPSMGTIGDAYDNAVIESFWARMQTELLDRRRWKTRVELANAIFEYLEIFHNRQRRHSALGWRTPVEFEKLHAAGDCQTCNRPLPKHQIRSLV